MEFIQKLKLILEAIIEDSNLDILLVQEIPLLTTILNQILINDRLELVNLRHHALFVKKIVSLNEKSKSLRSKTKYQNSF